MLFDFVRRAHCPALSTIEIYLGHDAWRRSDPMTTAPALTMEQKHINLIGLVPKLESLKVPARWSDSVSLMDRCEAIGVALHWT
jgi:hypothetical protein